MARILTLSALLMLWTVSLTSADIFKCQKPDGTIIFTDKSSNADCKLERVEALPLLGTISDSVPAGASVPATGSAKPAASGGNKTYEDFKGEVSLLVEQFTSARRGTMRGLAKYKLAARRDLTEIRARKGSLTSEIQRSSLSSREKQELTEALATITE